MKKNLLALLCMIQVSAISLAQPLMIGHRGSYWGVENTAEAFINGAQAGYNGLECDIKVTADGVYVISHDDNLSRLGHSVSIESSTLAALKELELSQTRGGVTYTGHICTVAEYLDICNQYDCFPVIELKWSAGIHSNDAGNNDFSKIPGLIELVREKGLAEKAVILSSMKGCLEYIRTNYPEIQIQFLTGQYWANHFDWCVQQGFDVDIEIGYFDESTVKKFHDAGLKVNVWTINSESNFLTYYDYGCDMITTDYFKLSDITADISVGISTLWSKRKSELSFLATEGQSAMGGYNGKLYIPNYETQRITVVNGEDGSLVEELSTDLPSGKITGISITEDGVLLLGGTNGGSDMFYIARCDLTTGETLQSFAIPVPGLGEANYMATIGSFLSSEGGYLATASNSGKAAIIPFANGAFGEAKVIPGHGVTALASQAVIKDRNSFFITGQSVSRKLYNLEGEVIAQFGENKPSTMASSAICFTLGGKEIFISAENKVGILKTFNITNGVEQATVVGNTTSAMGRGANNNLTTPLCVEYVDDYAIVYLLAPNNGMAAYKIYTRGSSELSVPTEESLQIFAHDGNIYIRGVEVGEPITIFDLTGRILMSTTAQRESIMLNLSLPQQTVIITTRKKAVKVRL